MVFRKSLKERHLNEFYPTPDYLTSDYRKTENQHQLNIKELNDKIDKTKNEEIRHSILTMELVKEKFISDENHSLLIKFDDLFQNKLEKGYKVQELFSAIHYSTKSYLKRFQR